MKPRMFWDRRRCEWVCHSTEGNYHCVAWGPRMEPAYMYWLHQYQSDRDHAARKSKEAK